MRMTWKLWKFRMAVAAALIGLALLPACRRLQAEESAIALPELALQADDRLLILAPHPDDEALACGGLIQRAQAMRLPVQVVFFTNGDNNEWSFMVYRKHPIISPEAVVQMGEVRRAEALQADGLLGLSATNLVFLGYPDFGTLKIWLYHWNANDPYRGMLTRATQVAYTNALRPGALFKGEEILRDLTTVVREFKPTRIFVSHPADHNPDHIALYLFVQVVLWDLQKEIHPAVYAYLAHAPNWPAPRGLNPNQALLPPVDLADQYAWLALPLTSRQNELKLAALKAHQSQFNYSGLYLSSFVRSHELFSDVPALPVRDVTRPQALTLDTMDAGMSEAVLAEERSDYVGIENRQVYCSSNQLVVKVRFTRKIEGLTQAFIACFGYRADTPFPQMPKFSVRIDNSHSFISMEQGRALDREVAVVERHAREVTVRVPLAALGRPEKVLTGARTYLGEMPLDWVAWRVLEIQ